MDERDLQAITSLQHLVGRWDLLLAMILDTAEEAIIFINEDHQILFANQGAERVFGYLSSEILGQNLNLLLPERFHDVHHQNVMRFGRSKDQARRMGERRQIYGRHRSGHEFPAEASISKVDTDEKTVFAVFLRDITDRKKLEDDLQEMNDRLQKDARAFHAGKNHQTAGLTRSICVP